MSAGASPTFRPRFGTSTVTYDYATYLKWIKAADDLGYDFAGHGDSQLLWADVYVTLAAGAMVTSRVRLAPMVTNCTTRHPGATAGAILSLQKLSHGRAVLGLGSGDSAVHTIGSHKSRLDVVESYVKAVHQLLSGSEAEWDGAKMRMRWQPEPVPIWLAAEGPRMLHLAGRVANGVVVGSGVGPGVIEDAIGRIHAGAREAGREPNDIEIWWKLNATIADTEESGWRTSAWSLASVANHVLRGPLAEKFVPAEHEAGIRALQRDYSFGEHGLASSGNNAALVEKHGLSAFLGNRFMLSGSADRMVERIREIGARGATNLLIGQFGPNAVNDLAEFHDKVMTRFQ